MPVFGEYSDGPSRQKATWPNGTCAGRPFRRWQRVNSLALAVRLVGLLSLNKKRDFFPIAVGERCSEADFSATGTRIQVSFEPG